MGYIFAEKPNKLKHSVLEQLYYKYAKLMKYVANSILHDEFLAEDAVQAAFLKLEKNNFRINSVNCNETKSLMVIIVRNIAIDIYHKKKKDCFDLEDEAISRISDDSILPLDIIISKENAAEIRNIISKIEHKYSDMLTIKYFYDYTNSQIAALFGITEQLVRVRLHRAKKMLLESLDKRMQE